MENKTKKMRMIDYIMLVWSAVIYAVVTVFNILYVIKDTLTFRNLIGVEFLQILVSILLVVVIIVIEKKYKQKPKLEDENGESNQTM